MDGLAVLLVEDQPALAEALRTVLDHRAEVRTIEIADCPPVARSKVMERDFDIALVDVRLGDANGIELVRELHVSHPELPVVVITAWPDSNTGAEAIWAGAHGFTSKDVSVDQLVEGLATVAAGGSWFPPMLLTGIHGVLRGQWEVAARLNTLSGREYDILALMVNGRSRADIAEILYLSVNTVRSHVRNVLRKLEVHSSIEAVGLALRAGLRPGDTSSRLSPGAREPCSNRRTS